MSQSYDWSELTDEDPEDDLLARYNTACRTFDSLVRMAHPHKRLLIIYSTRQSSRSTLLRKYRLICMRRCIPVALVDCKEVNSTSEMLASWVSRLDVCGVTLPTCSTALADCYTHPNQGRERPDALQALTEDFVCDLARVAAHQRIVLMIDGFERTTTVESWLCALAQRLPENVLLIIAGQAIPDWGKTWKNWKARAEIVELEAVEDLSTLIRLYLPYCMPG